MEKTLLLNFTGITEAKDNTAIVESADENIMLKELIDDMRPYLQEATKDLLQPRAEAIEKLLKKALG